MAGTNERLRHEPGPSAGCGADLADAPGVDMKKRQVFDLPPMTMRVTASADRAPLRLWGHHLRHSLGGCDVGGAVRPIDKVEVAGLV